MAKEKNASPEELRYNYLGFDVAPGKIKEFWESEEEKKKYLQKVRDKLGKPHTIERDFSMVNATLLNKADRYIISFASLLLVLSLFIPYYNFETNGGRAMGSAISYLLHVGYVGSFVAWGSLVMKITFFLSIVLILLSPAIGVFNLVALNTGLTSEGYFQRLKRAGKLNLLAISLYLVFFLLAISGQANPFGSLGMSALGENFTLLSLIQMSSFSLWLNIGAHVLGMIPALEL